MAQVGEEPAPSASRQAFGQWLHSENQRWGKVIAPLGIQLD
jgi:hypothetical protein